MREFNIDEKMIKGVLFSLIRERLLKIIDYKQRVNNFASQYPNDIFIDENKEKLADEFNKIMANFINEDIKIKEEDKKRALDYFKISVKGSKMKYKNFTKILIASIDNVIITINYLINDPDPGILRAVVENIFCPYLELLKENYNDGYEELTAFINETLYENFNYFDYYLVDFKENFFNSHEPLLNVNVNNVNINNKITNPNKFLSYNHDIEKKYLIIPLPPFDREVYNAIATLYHCKYKIFTPQIIFDLLSGNKKREKNNANTKITLNIRKKIQRSIAVLKAFDVNISQQKISNSELLKYQENYHKNERVEFDTLVYKYIKIISMEPLSYEEERKYRNLRFATANSLYHLAASDDEKVKFPLLKCFTLKNKKIQKKYYSICYEFIEGFGLPMYSELQRTNQLISFDIELLDTPLKNTEENIVLKCYLLRTIVEKKELNYEQITILFDDIYKYFELELNQMTPQEINALRVKQFDIRDKTEKLLLFWNDKDLFSSFNINTKKIIIIF